MSNVSNVIDSVSYDQYKNIRYRNRTTKKKVRYSRS